MRFPLEVFDAVRAAFPADKPAVGVRISASDWVDGGWDVEQSVAFTQALKARGAGYIHVSSGGASPLQQIPAVPGYQLEFAERIKKEVGLPTIAVGLITEAEAGRSHHRVRPGRFRRPRARHAVRPALALARRSEAGRTGRRSSGAASRASSRSYSPG
jgi:hypothetical protein